MHYIYPTEIQEHRENKDRIEQEHREKSWGIDQENRENKNR